MRGVNPWKNKYPAICYKCGAKIPVGGGRIVAWRKVTTAPLRVQCFKHVESQRRASGPAQEGRG